MDARTLWRVLPQTKPDRPRVAAVVRSQHRGLVVGLSGWWLMSSWFLCAPSLEIAPLLCCEHSSDPFRNPAFWLGTICRSLYGQGQMAGLFNVMQPHVHDLPWSSRQELPTHRREKYLAWVGGFPHASRREGL